jgi:hypothetical protein
MANITYQTSILKLAITVLLIHITTFSLMRLQQVLLFGKAIAHLLIIICHQIWECLWITVFFSDSLTQ